METQKKEKIENITHTENGQDTIQDTENIVNKNKLIKLPLSVKIIFILLVIICLFFILYNFYVIYKPKLSKDIAVSNIVISIPSLEIETGVPIEIQTKIEPKDYTYSNLQWISSNPEVISVENGIITALIEGESTIYAINDNGVKSNELLIYSIVKMKEISLSKENLELNVDSSETLIATISPEDTTNKDLIWESSDENIATIDENGTVTAKNIGTCTITVSSIDLSIVTKCEITVNPIEISSLSLDETNVTLGMGQQYILIGSIYPSNATYKNFTWSSSDNSVLTVDNGKIKAISEGNATVTITSKNGKATSCSFTVTSSLPSKTIRYAKGTYSIRTGPSNNYSKLATVYRNDEVEILKSANGWTKVRISSGVVGYILSNGYSASKTYYIENVPYLNQFTLGYPTDCEAVSATMVAKFAGYNVSSAQIISATPTDEKGKRQETITTEVSIEKVNEETGETETIITTEDSTDWYGGNPFEVFVGHPTKGLSSGSYGCFAKPITIALQSCGVPATNISGCSIDTVFNYVASGKPVVVWCKKNAGDLTEGVTWKYEDGSGSYTELVGEHCAVLIGYDADYVYLNDPSAGKNVKQPRAKFTSNWYKLFSQAIIIN